jgi:hypothetical protein
MVKPGKSSILKLDLVFNAWRNKRISDSMRWELMRITQMSGVDRIAEYRDAITLAYHEAPV